LGRTGVFSIGQFWQVVCIGRSLLLECSRPSSSWRVRLWGKSVFDTRWERTSTGVCSPLLGFLRAQCVVSARLPDWLLPAALIGACKMAHQPEPCAPAALSCRAARQLPPGWQWLPEPEVALFTATNLPRLDMNFHLAPDATPDSGEHRSGWTCCAVCVAFLGCF